MKEQFRKYLEGTASADQKREILTHVKSSETGTREFELEKEEWKNDEERVISLAAWNAWKKVKREIAPEISFTRKLVISSLSAASIVFIIMGLSIFWLGIQSNKQVSIYTASGQLTEAYLPDSSKVILNCNSTITYRTSMLGLKREVEIDGEAYFDVRSKMFSSFDVVSNDVRVHVTGTQFNVQAYKDEDVRIVLEEGSVMLTMKSDPEFVQRLKPGELIRFDNETNKIIKRSIKTKDFTSWKEGVLYFENNKLPDLLKTLERRYGVSFEQIEDPILKEFTLTFTIRNERFGKVMDLIKAALPIEVVTHDEKIEVKLDEKRYRKI